MSQAPFVPQLLLGADHVRPADKAAIRDFLRKMLRYRRCPLHINSLWNALYFDWTPDCGYVGLPPERIETRRLGETAPAVPVGGFVCVESGSGKDVWAEVIYKEGRHPLLGVGGAVSQDIAGARAEPVDRNGSVASILREVLILDWDAFGKLTEKEHALVAKLQRRNRRLDRFQHLVMDAAYDLDDVELDDATFYARYLFTRHREGLLAEFVRDGTPDEELYAATLTSLRAVADIAYGVDELLAWNGYFFLEADYEAMITDAGANSLTGREFLEDVLRGVAFLPGRPWKPELTAIGARVFDWFERGSGVDEGKHALLDGTGYVRLVCFANTYVADHVSQSPEGVIKAGHVRLEDPWQFGGIWSCHPVSGTRPAWMRIPCMIPIGTASPDLPDLDEVAGELAGAAAALDITVSANQRNWRITLPATAWASGEFPAGKAVMFFDTAVSEVRLRLSVAGEAGLLVDAPVALDRERRVLSNVPWPLQLYPGVKIAAWVERGGQVVRAHIRRLPAPLTIEGRRLSYDLDETAYRRALHVQAPMDGRVFRKASSLSEIIGRVFRRRGELADEHTYALHLMEIAVALLGPGPRAQDVRPILAELRRMGLSRDDQGRYLWAANRITRRTRLTDRSLLEAYGETSGGVRLRRAVRAHWVRAHLRRWDHKDPRRRAEREATYEAAIIASKAGHRLAPPLPAGYTYVASYEKGSDDQSGAS